MLGGGKVCAGAKHRSTSAPPDSVPSVWPSAFVVSVSAVRGSARHVGRGVGRCDGFLTVGQSPRMGGGRCQKKPGHQWFLVLLCNSSFLLLSR